MSESAIYSVSTNGAAVSGFEIENVIATFASAFGVPPEKAATYVQQPKLVKKNLSLEDAEAYRQRLAEIGVSVVVKEHTANGVRDVDTNTAGDAGVLGLVPAENEPETAAEANSNTGFICPKCDLPQEKSDQCAGCGIFFEKYFANSTASNSHPEVAGTTNPVQASRQRAAVRQDHDTDEDTFSIGILVLPIAAAIIGAFVWKFIAITFGFELGLIAWAIGGATGAAAAMAGGRGEGIGVACAVLALLAIFGGKYMIMSSYQAQWSDALAGNGEPGLLEGVYEEVSADAKAFAKISKDDSSIKTFMVQHEYSDAKKGLFVTDAELDDFRMYTQPWLEASNTQGSSAEEWASDQLAEVGDSLSDVSTTSLVFSSLELLDIVFVLLGISTAFQLGRAGRDN